MVCRQNICSKLNSIHVLFVQRFLAYVMEEIRFKEVLGSDWKLIKLNSRSYIKQYDLKNTKAAWANGWRFNFKVYILSVLF